MTTDKPASKKPLWLIGGGFVLFFAIIGFSFSRLDMEMVHQKVGEWNGVVVFSLMAILPLVGFPVSFINVIAGIRFGSALGFALVSLSIVIHLFAAYWIGHSFLGKFIEMLLRKTKHELPEIPKKEAAPITLLTTLIPGLSYTVKNYIIVLGGVPLKTILWVCLPSYIIRSVVAVFFGDWSKNLDATKITFLVVYLIAISLLCRYLYKRLKAKREK